MRTATRDEIISVLQKQGYKVIRRTDHVFMKKENGRTIKIPNEHTDISVNLFHEILKQMGITKKKFEELLTR